VKLLSDKSAMNPTGPLHKRSPVKYLGEISETKDSKGHSIDETGDENDTVEALIERKIT